MTELAPQTADVKFKLSDYKQMLKLKCELFKNADETVQIEWLDRLLHIFRLNIEIQDVLVNALPPVEQISVADAAFLLPELMDVENLSIFTSTIVHYLGIFEGIIRSRWNEVFANLMVKNHFSLYNNEYQKLLHIINDRKDRLSKTALTKINTILCTSINAITEYLDEIRAIAMEIKELTDGIFADVVDINYYSHKMILELKRDCKFDVENGNALNVITMSGNRLSIETALIFEKVKEINEILDYVENDQKYLPHKIIEFMSINDLE